MTKLLLFLVILLPYGCCSKTDERANGQNGIKESDNKGTNLGNDLILSKSKKRLIFQLEGIGKLPDEEYEKLIKESRMVIKAPLVYLLRYSSFTSSIDNAEVEYDLNCLMFKVITPFTYKGSWPSAGILIDDKDIVESQENHKKFYEIGDEYLIFLQGDTPIESEVIKVRRLTIHGQKVLD